MKKKSMQGKQKRVVYVITSILVALFWLIPSQVHAATAQEFINSGEDALYSESIDGILQAHSIFQNAKAAYPNDAVINAYLAMTRLLHLGLTTDSGGLQDLLSKFGIVRTGHDLETLVYYLPKNDNDRYNIPETAPSGESFRTFLSGALLNAVNESIANLDITINMWSDTDKHIVANAKTRWDTDIEIDYGDIYLFRAGLKMLKSMVLAITAYDMNVDLREIAALKNLEAFSERDILDRYQDFLNLIPTPSTPTGNGTNQLALARTVLLEAIDDYIVASQKIRNDNVLTPGAEELIEIDQCDYLIEEWFRDSLTSIKNSLTGISGPIAEIPDKEEEWLFTDGATGKRIKVTLEHNMSQGEFNGIDGGDFVGWSGDIDCIAINGDQIYIEMESSGWPYSEITFSGTLNKTSDAISGSYNGSSAEGPVSGNFTAARISVLENIERINLKPFFGNGSGPYDVRNFLPEFNACDDPVPGTVGFGFNPFVPDATLGGILPDYIQDDWGLGPVSCILTGTSVTGTLSVPEHNGKGLLYIQIFHYYGQYNTDPANRLGFQVIYANEFVEGMTYNLDYVPVGVQVFVTAWWDVDHNGVLTAGDNWTRFPVFITRSGQTYLNLKLNHGYASAMPWIPLLLLGD